MSTRRASRDLATTVGINLRAARDEAGLTQHALALLLGSKTSNQTISDWERGVNRPSDENLLRLAAVLQREFTWFFSEPADDEAVAA